MPSNSDNPAAAGPQEESNGRRRRTSSSSSSSSSLSSCVVAPFIVIIDNREQQPFRFDGFTEQSRNGEMFPLLVPQQRGTLKQGDYSLYGFENRVAIERKSLHDLFHTIAHERERFNEELKRMAQLVCDLDGLAAVVVEAKWSRVMKGVRTTKMHPGAIARFVKEWSVCQPRLTWHWCDGREAAMRTTFELLKKWWEAEQTKGCGANEGGEQV